MMCNRVMQQNVIINLNTGGKTILFESAGTCASPFPNRVRIHSGISILLLLTCLSGTWLMWLIVWREIERVETVTIVMNATTVKATQLIAI